MGKKRDDNVWILVGVLSGIIVMLVIFLFVIVGFNSNKKDISSEDNFKIISASWNDSYDNWDFLCSKQTETISSLWFTTTQQSEDLSCYYILNGEKKEQHTRSSIGKEIIVYDAFFEGIEIHSGRYSLDFTKKNEITICCFENNKENEICDSIILPAKCEL